MKREGVVTSIEKRIQRNTAAAQEIGFYRNWCNRQATTLAPKEKKRNEIDCHQVIVSRKVCTIKLNEDLVWQSINGYIIAQCRHFRIKSYQPEGGIFYSFLARIFISFHPFTRIVW
jgi:hypothetical protein